MSNLVNSTEARQPTKEFSVTPIYSEDAMIRTCPIVYGPLLRNTDRRRSHCVATTYQGIPVFRKFATEQERTAYMQIPDAVLPFVCMPRAIAQDHLDFAYIPSDPTTTISFLPFEDSVSDRQTQLITALADFEFACQNEEEDTYFLHGDCAAHNVFFDESVGLQVYDLEKAEVVDLQKGKYSNFADFISRLWFAPQFQRAALRHVQARLGEVGEEQVFLERLQSYIAKKRNRTTDYYDHTSDVSCHFLHVRKTRIAAFENYLTQAIQSPSDQFKTVSQTADSCS